MRTISLYCFSLGLIVTHTDVATGAAWGGGGTVAAPSFWLPTLGHRAGATSSLRREATVFPQDDFASVFQKHRDLASGEAVWPFVEKELLGVGDGDRGFATLLQPRGQRSGRLCFNSVSGAD